MKRVLTVLAILLLPLSVWAMTPVSDSDLSAVTGQAGVNINADVTMNIMIGTMAWGDATGVDTSFAAFGWATTDTGVGYVGVTNFNLTNLRIKARENDTFNGYTTAMLKPITIDVATGTSHGAGVTSVRFGLGSLQISLDALSLNVALGTAGNSLTQILGSANLGPMAVYISPASYVDIYTASGVGVNIFMHVIIDQFTMSYMSWGDSDGAGTNMGAGGVPWFVNSTGGYVGLQDLVIGGPISIDGSMRIDVGTVGTGVYAAHGAVTVVHISFNDNFTVAVTGPITANVRLGSAADLNSGTFGTLGDIYISGITMQIANGSWVDISAH